MPVEANRIKGRLKELFPKANLSNKRLDEISARLAKRPADDAQDSEIDQLLNDTNEVYPFAEMARDEHRAVEAERKLKLLSSTSADEKDTNDDSSQNSNQNQSQSQKEDEAVPAWAKALLTEVQELKNGKIIETKTQAARAEFEKNPIFKSIPEAGREFYFRQIDVNSETPFADQIKSLEETHTLITQSKADTTGFAGKPPVGANGVTASKEMIAAIVNKGR